MTGTNLQDPENDGEVKFSGIVVTPSLLTDTKVQLTVPTGATSGQVLIYSSGVPVVSSVFTVN